MRYVVRPLSDRTWLGTKGTEPSANHVTIEDEVEQAGKVLGLP